MKKRALSWLLALTMLLTLAPQTLPVWASATGEKSNTATQTESKLSANTYSALGLSRSIKPSDEGLDQGKQPYGDAVEGNTVATNVINELYVNFNGSIHYGWSILDNIPMEYRDNSKIGTNWKSKDNSYGAMGYWRSGASVDYENGNSKNGALFAKNGSIDDSTTYNHVESGSDINSANKHIVYQYSKSEAFSPNTGKDNYVAELVVDDNGDVHLYLYQVEGGNKRYVRGTKIGHNPFVGDASNKTNVIWNWEYDAMFDIAAGDMDGDGYDEIAVYTATGTESDNKQEVHLYRYEGGALTEITTQAVTKPNNGNASGQKLKLGTAVVTLAFGDLNADDKDELVIAENMGYGASNIADGKVRIYALQKNNELKQQKEISLKIQEQGSNLAMARYANVATGDIDNDNQDELVIAGYPGVMGTIAGTAVSGINGNYISYNIIDGKDYRANGWETVTFDKKDLLGRVVDNNDQLIPPVSLTCAATQGVGYAEQVFLSGCLYSVDTSKNSDNTNKFSLEKLTEISTNREYKKDNGKKANKEEIFVVNVVAGNFNGNRNGQEQIVYAFGMKHDDSDRYWYDIGYINKKNPGNSDSDYWYGQEQVMNFESSYNRDQNKRRASLYLSLAAVDCDNDSTLMRYKGQEVTWTKPEVLTILQSAPYFQDLEDTRGYINQGQTGYGKGQGSGSSATAGTSLSVGTYVSFEQDFSVFGVKIASIQAEAQTKHSFNYGYEHNQTVETEVNYSGSAGDDYAVVYAVPYMEYQYETWVPGYTLPNDKTEYNKYLDNYLEGKLGKTAWATADKTKERTKAEKELGIHKGMPVKGSWQPCTVSVPMTPRTVMLSVDDYDDIANVTEGLQPIRGNILNSTPGDPTTYDVENSRKDFNKIGTLQTVTKAQGSNISVTQTATTEEEHSFEYDYEFEAKVGAGAGGLTVGVLAGFGANAGGGISTSTSKSYSATVDNLPSDADGYTLSWQFGWRKAKLNNNDVLVLEYQQKDTKAKPSPPKNLRVESVTSNSVTLTWDPVTGAGAYVIYQVGADGKQLFEMNTLAGTASSWTNTGLSSNRAYTYVAKTIAQSGEESITSVSVSTSTLEANKDNFKILEQPKEQGEAAAGDSVNMSVSAEYRNEDGSLNDLHYQWETYNTEKKQWESISGAKQPTYTVTVTEKNDGKRYRCQVYSSASLYLYSKEVTLKVGRSATTTSLTSASFNQTVKSAYLKETQEPVTEIVDNREVPVYEQKQVTEKINETTYDVYLVNETEVYFAKTENGKYYTKSGTSLTEVGPAKTNFIMYNDMKILMDNLITSAFDNGEQVTYTETNEDGETDATGLKTYTATKKFIYSYTDNGTTKALTLFFAKTTGDSNGIYLVKQSGDTGKTYLPVEVETEETIKVGETKVEISSLQAKMEDDTNKPVTRTVQTKEAGDPVELKATISGTKPTGTVTFKIVNTTGDGGAMIDVEVGANGTATTTWTPTTSGIYVVTAIYSGSEMFKESQSQSYTINVVTPGEKKLVVSGENMTYGESQTLKATLFDGDSAENISAQTVNATYTVSYNGGTATALEGSTFTPDKAGTYTITASYKPTGSTTAITSTKVITVNRKTVTVVPKVVQDANGNLTTDYDILDGTTKLDKSIIPSAKIKVTCGAVTSDGKKPGAGVYPITVTYTSDDLTNAKYLVVCDNSKTYEIKDDVVHVTNATTNSNGKVNLSYTYNDQTYAVNGDGGSGYIPKGAKLTATAQPNVGYRVEKWSEKTGEGGTESPIFSSDNVFNTAAVITKTNVQEEYSIKADFTEVYYKLAMGFATGSSGSIVAKYLTDAGTEGDVFYSTSPSMTPTTASKKLSPLKKVRITATPSERQVISGWRISSGSDNTGTLVTNEDGTTYTGNTYTVSTISADTNIVVETDTKTEKTVSVTLKNQDGVVLSNQAYVSFNNVKAEREDGKYTYSGSTHDNIVVTLTIPDSLIVDSWKVGETELNVGTLSNNKKTLSLSNLEDNLDLVVQCKAPNSYAVNVTKQLNGETPSADPCQSITITKNGTANPVDLDPDSSDNKVLEATVLRVVIQPNDGYELLNVTYNGQEQDTEKTGQTEAFTINGVHDTVNIVANFVQKPLVTVNNDADKGDVTVTGTVNRAPGTPKPYADYQTALTILLQPKVGYVVEGIKLNDNTTAIGTDQMQAGNGDDYTYITDSLTADVKITPVWKALAQHTVTFFVVDTNGEEAGGENGELKAAVDRNGIVGYQNNNFTTGNIVYEGSKITFTATPAEGYRVKEWQINDNIKQDYLEETLTLNPEDITANTKVTVQFTPIGDTATFSAGENGRITSVKLGGNEVTNFNSGFTLEPGATIEVTAEPVAGYEVEQWSVNGVKQSETGNTFTYTAKTTGSVGAAISVTFQPVKYSITWGGTNGRVTAAGYDGSSAEIRGGKALTFTATPANGYKFDHWTVNGVKSEGAMNPLAWTVPHGQAETTPVNSYEIRAVFVSDEQTHTVTYTVNDAAGGTVTTESGNNGSITVAAGTNLTFTAHPNQYYHVQAWMLDAQTVDGTANQLTYTLNNVRATHTVTVVFSKAVSYDVGYAVTDEDNGSLSATENGTALTLGAKQQKAVSAGAKLVFTAAPNSNNMVAEWSVNDTPVTRTNMTELGVKMDHYLSNTLTIESLDKAVTVKVKFKTYEAVSIPTSDTGYMITTDKRIPMETYIGAPTNEIRKNGDLTFTVKPYGTKHYMTIGTLVINGYDCIANKVTDETKYNAKCDSVSAKKNDDGSYTVTITNVKDEVEKTIVAHQVIVGGLTVPAAFAGKEELNSAEKIRTKLEASFTGSKDGMAFYDIALKYYDGTQWVDVNETNFPANGVDVVLPYPTGTNKQDRFQIVHMLTHSGHEGEIERITASNETDGLHFHVNSLSPFGVSWVKYVAPTPGGGGGGGGGAVSTYTLTFDTNGGSAIDKITKDSGTTIDLAAYKPTRAGYTFAGWFSDKALTKAVTSVKLTANTTVYAKWTQSGTAQNPFVDVKEGAYYYDAVLWAVEQKITSGTSATTFSPDASCTRAQMVTFLWRAAGSPKVENGKNPFTDVKADAYYYDAVLWAVEKGVTSGTSATTFSPDSTVTRGQTVTFLYRNAGSPEVSGTMPFADVEADAYYAKAVQWAVQQKITTGTRETTFSPMSDCTRGQIVTFLYRAK